MAQKVIKAGNSLAVTIPSEFVKSVGVKVGDEVTVEYFIEKGEVTCFFSGVKQLLLSSDFIKRKRRKINR